MAEHVDLVKNEWLAGFQMVVARFRLDSQNQDRVILDTSSPDRWEHLLQRALESASKGVHVDARQDAQRFLEHLHEVLSGDYLFATELHDESECQFTDMVVPIQSAEREVEKV
jgi:hypothetical protein